MAIKQLGKKKFLIDFRTSSGRRKRITVEGSKGLAEAIWNDIQVKKFKREYLGVIELQKISLSDFVDKYSEFAKANKSKKGSYIERCTAESKIIPFFGADTLLTEINPHLIEQFKIYRLKEVKPATVNRSLSYLKHAFKMAIEWGFLKDNPASSVKKLREPSGRVRWLRPIEVEELIECSNERLKSIALFAINTGLRAGEIKKLKWNDIFMKSLDSDMVFNNSVNIQYLDYSKGGVFVRESKNNSSRIVPMNDMVLKIIKELPRKNDFVFEGKGFRGSFEDARIKAKLSDFVFHDLRHTFASYLVMNGVDIRTVQYLMGHKDIKMTARYSHLSQGHLQNAVDKLNSIFSLDTFWTPDEKVKV